jgi:acyl-CoA reductase-like NAD-dependent aldehyde dehydrogenase
MDKLLKAYSQVKAGDPLAEGTLLGPLHTKTGVEAYKKGISKIKEQVNLSLKALNFLVEINSMLS